MDGIIKQKTEQTGRFNVQVKKEEKPKIELKTSLPFIKWEAEEYEYIPKSNNWFWSVGIITVGLVFASILLDNFLFAILVLISGLAVILYGARRPRKILFSLAPRGLQIENRLFPYENLKSFWLHYEPPYKKILIVESKKVFAPSISVPLGDVNPNTIRDHLLKFLKEQRHEETFTQTIMRLIGF